MPYRSQSSEAAAVDWFARESPDGALLQATHLPAYSGLRSSIREVTGSEGLGLLDAANGTSLRCNFSFNPPSRRRLGEESLDGSLPAR